MVLADAGWAEKRGLAPKARLVSYGIAAVEPGMFGLGPIPAVQQALARAGWEAGSVERVEINEAFAAIAIVVTRELRFPEDIVRRGRRGRARPPDRRNRHNLDHEADALHAP
jgi:acetyl-CoA C-acetyltransferase